MSGVFSSVGCFLGLLDQSVQNDNPLANERAVERSAKAGATARPKFEQAIAKSARVQDRPIHELDEWLGVGEYIRQRFDDVEHDKKQVLLGLGPNAVEIVFFQESEGKGEQVRLSMSANLIVNGSLDQ